MTNRGRNYFFCRIKYCWQKRDERVALSPLHTIRHCLRTVTKLFCEKNYVSRKVTKKFLWFSSKNRLLWRTHFAKKFSAKCSIIRRITLYTLFAIHTDFVRSFLFRPCSRIVCRALHCSLFADANPAYGVRRKTCSQNTANAFYTLFAVCRFFVGSPLFRSCSWIVYSPLHTIRKQGRKRNERTKSVWIANSV